MHGHIKGLKKLIQLEFTEKGAEYRKSEGKKPLDYEDELPALDKEEFERAVAKYGNGRAMVLDKVNKITGMVH